MHSTEVMGIFINSHVDPAASHVTGRLDVDGSGAIPGQSPPPFSSPPFICDFFYFAA